MMHHPIILKNNQHARVISFYLIDEKREDPEMFDFKCMVDKYLAQYYAYYRSYSNGDRSNYLEAKEWAYNEVFREIDADLISLDEILGLNEENS